MIKDNIKKLIQEAFQKSFDWTPDEIGIINPEPQFGDFAVACHSFAKELKQSPQDIASKLADSVKSGLIMKAEAVAGYLNITVDTGALAKEVLSDVLGHDKDYGSLKKEKGKRKKEKILLEYSSPNTNKPLHLGHVRNNVLGMSLANILETQGKEVIKTQIINDKGIHIIKSMLAYQRWGQGKSPEDVGEKGDHFVGKFYVMFEKEFEKEWQEHVASNPVPDKEKDKKRQEFFKESKIGSEAQEMLRKWEAADKEVLKLWNKMNKWVYEGFAETYKKLGSEFKKDYHESETYILGNKIVEEGLQKGIFEKEQDGSVWVDLTDAGLDRKILKRSDGTAVYITQDLGLAVERQKEWRFSAMVYVVGHEQEYHFKVLFEILKRLGYGWAENLHHLSYGLVFLPEGKMKSREGKVVDADNIISEVNELAQEEIKKRFPEISKHELKDRSDIIGMGALKFMLLKITPTQSIYFNPKEAIAFEGSTGPYVQYAHARISSILKKESASENVKFKLLDKPEEKALILKLQNFPQVVSESAGHYNPSSLCNYLLELSQVFNTFYHKHQVLKAGDEDLKKARLLLIRSVQIVLKNGLELLGIKAPEKM